jgi:hypothetical protein
MRSVCVAAPLLSTSAFVSLMMNSATTARLSHDA